MTEFGFPVGVIGLKIQYNNLAVGKCLNSIAKVKIAASKT